MHREVCALDEPLRTNRRLQRRIGSYVGLNHRVVKHLASGGMADVFLAEHVRDGQAAAVKLAAIDARAPTDMLRREATFLAHLKHPNIQRLIEHGLTADGAEYLLSEFIPGLDLDDWMALSGPSPSPGRALKLLQPLALALDHLHDSGIVHCDIKPANVMVDPNRGDRVTLIDFGLAFERSRVGVRPAGIGTPGYMAPEQLDGGRCGPAIDRYAFAAVSFELLAGKPLQPNASSWYPGQIAHVHTRRSLEPSLSCRGMDAVFARALHSDPAERFGSAAGFVGALAEALALSKRVSTTRYEDCALSA